MVARVQRCTPAVSGKTQRAPVLGKMAKPSVVALKPIEWAGKYAVSSAEYTEGICGPKALELQKLNNALGERGQVKVEKSISIPFGTIDEVIYNHYENAGSATKLRLAKEARASDTALQHSRAALKSLKFPGLMRQDVVNAMLQEGMALPTSKGDWASLQRDVFTAAAMICRAPFTRDVSEIDQALKRPLSLIVRDSVHREYDFSVSMNSNGEVTGEVRLPYSANRGIRFATRGAGSEPRTVRLPVPQFGASIFTGYAELDGEDVPQAVLRTHTQPSWTPAKITFEGDNMLLCEQYKAHVYRALADTAQRVANSGVAPFSTTVESEVQVDGYITKNLDVVVSEVSSSNASADVGHDSDSLWSSGSELVAACSGRCLPAATPAIVLQH